MHQDELTAVPAGVQLLASTEKCKNQGMYQKGRLITMQGHPEYTEDIIKHSLYARQDILAPDVYKDGMRRLRDHDDGMIITQGFLRFLLEEN